MRIDIKSKDFILITPSEYHNDLVKFLRADLNIKFKIYSKEDVISSFYGKYDILSIIKVMNDLDLSFENAKMLLDNINFSCSDYNDKIRKLYDIRTKLEHDNLLTKNEYLAHEFVNKNVYVYGYGESDIELEVVLNKLNAKTHFLGFSNDKYVPQIHEFRTINDEVYFVLNSICDLLNNGVKQKDIVLVIDENRYAFAINKMCEQFNLPALIDLEVSYLYKPQVLKLINGIEITGLDDFVRYNEFSDDAVVLELLQIINDYHLLTIKDSYKQVATLKSILNATKITESSEKYFVTKSSLGLSDDSKYYFFLGFNQSKYPKIQKDDDYLTNKEKAAINHLTSFASNKVSKSKLVSEITNTKNLFISYSLNSNNNVEYPSSLIKEFNWKVIKDSYAKNIYSKKEGMKILAKLEDLKRKYAFDSDLRHSYMHLFEVPYLTYNHHFETITSYRPTSSKRVYSYSNIKDYFICPFKYYLTRILAIDDFEDTFNTKIGKLFHKVLENIYDDDFDYDLEYKKAYELFSFTAREEVLLEKIQAEFKYFVSMLLNRKNNMNFKYALKEKTYIEPISDEVSVKGVIDSVIITHDNEKEYYSIVDYKTGNEKYQREEVDFGFSMQLPTYALLLQNEAQFKNKELIGFYIQRILNDEINLPLGNETNFIADNFKLAGEFSVDLNKMRTFSRDLTGVKNLKDNITIGKKNTNTPEQFEEIINLAKQKFLEADQAIQKGVFDISPAKIVGKSTQDICKYCPFGDICNKEDSDYRLLEIKGDDTNGVDE